MGKAHALEDRKHLETLTTGHLTKLSRNAARSIAELTEYQKAIDFVLGEREKRAAEELAQTHAECPGCERCTPL